MKARSLLLAAGLLISPMKACNPSLVAHRCSQFEQVAVKAGWPSKEVPKLSRTMFRESRCNPRAYNGRNRDRSYGLVQINTKGALWGEVARRCHLTSREQLFDAHTNLACGHRLFVVYGWRPWAGGA